MAAASQASPVSIHGDGPVPAWEALVALPKHQFLQPWRDAELSPKKTGRGSGRHGSVAKQWGRAPKYIFCLYLRVWEPGL